MYFREYIMEEKNINYERLKNLFDEVVREAVSLGIPISRNIHGPVINTRAKARFGCCKANKKTIGPVSYTIEISERVLAAGEKNIKEIIAHELLHTCRGCMNHGKKWKEYAEVFRKGCGYKITRTTSYESLGLEVPAGTRQSEPYKYVLVCQKCGGKIMRRRRCSLVEKPHLYRCGKCGGNLELQAKNTTSCR